MTILAGKAIAITGAASGIGRASALRAIQEGAMVLAVDRDGDGLESLREEAGGALMAARGEVRDESFIAQSLDAAVAEWGRLDGLATIAGISESGVAITEIGLESWERIFAVNVTATWRWICHAIPHFKANGGGAIVTIASQLAFAGGRYNAAYIASKGAVVSLTKTAAFELAPDHIRVNAVAPGATETALLERGMANQPDPEAARDYSRRRHAMGRFGEPGEIANGVVWLLSEQARFVTGTTLVIDGGWLAA